MMKKVLTLTESELIKVINRIVESYGDDSYSDEDYVEVFFNYFRPWVRKNHGDEIGEYPLSYLAKKYMSEFAKDNGMNPDNVIYSYRTNLANAANVGKEMVKQGKHKLPSLRSQEKFTEKFKKPLEFFLTELNLPDFIKVEFIEQTPYNVYVKLDVDWVGLIKYQGDVKPNFETIFRELKKRIEDFLGVEIGNPTYGQLSFKMNKQYIGVDEWVKKTLNKEIKKKIKELPNASRILHAIRFETHSSSSMGGDLKLSYKSWNGSNEFIKSVRSLLQDMGYNTEILQVGR
jgi:hypothetical protein